MNTTKADAAKDRKARAVAKAKKTTVAELHALIHTELETITSLLAIVRRDLMDTRNPTGVLVTVQMRKAMTDQLRTERRDRTRATTNADPVRRQWMSPSTIASGPVPIPGSVASYSVEAEATATMRNIATVIHNRLDRAGVCYLHPTRLRYLHADLDHRQVIHPLPVLITIVRDLVDVTVNTNHLRQIHRDLVELTEKLHTVVDGPGQSIPPDPRCPICHRPTLIAELRTHPQTIRCDRDQKTGELEPCRCDDRFCLCTRKPSFRHTWTNTPRNTKVDLRWTYMGLQDHQNRWRRALTTPTRRHSPVTTTATPTPDLHHQIKMTWRDTTTTKTVECTADTGAPCRQAYACSLDETCDLENGKGHDGTCIPMLVDLEYCNITAWLRDHVDEAGEAELTIPVAIEGDGNNFLWAPTGAPVTTTPINN